MAVETSRLARLRAVELSPAGFRRLAALSVLMLFAIVSTGATVRLTASGLGCEHLPGCQPRDPFPQASYHPAIDLSHRTVSASTILAPRPPWLSALRPPGPRRWVASVARCCSPGTVSRSAPLETSAESMRCSKPPRSSLSSGCWRLAAAAAADLSSAGARFGSRSRFTPP